MNTNYPSVDIVICAYNDKKLTAKCIDSLLALSYPCFRIILVDDCSPDDSVSFLRNKYPDITIIENKKNLGPAKTRNAGIRISKAKYVVTMDNDATLSSNWLTKMIELMESDRTIGQAVGKIIFPDKPTKLAAAGGSMRFRCKSYDIGMGESINNPRYNKVREILVACSASMIVRRSVLELIGGFCDIYYHGYEDSDLSFRINIAGYKVIYYPKAVSWHILSKTVNRTIGKKRVYYWIRNRLLLMLRNYGFKNLVKYLPVNIRFTLSDCRSHTERISSAILSWLWIIFHLPSIIAQRRGINNYRKIGDKELHKLFNLE